MAHASLRTAAAWLRAVLDRLSPSRNKVADRRVTWHTVDAARYRAALTALPAETQRIFVLHRVDGLDIATIAERTGSSTAVVEQHVANAILAIGTAIDADQA